jgi:hypothetical protein
VLLSKHSMSCHCVYMRKINAPVFFLSTKVSVFGQGFSKCTYSYVNIRDGCFYILAKSLLTVPTSETLKARLFKEKHFVLPWWRGKVVIASASRTEDPGLESHQGVRFLGLYTLQCSCQNWICIVILCIWENKWLKIFFFNFVCQPFIVTDV